MLASSSLAGLDGVISVGGDGMFAQVFNGLLVRVARDAGVEVEASNVLLIMFSVLIAGRLGTDGARSPGPTSEWASYRPAPPTRCSRQQLLDPTSLHCPEQVAMSLHGTTDPVTAALHIALGSSRNIDATSLHTETGLER